MAFREVDDKLWIKIKPILTAEKPKIGRPGTELRRAFNDPISADYWLCMVRCSENIWSEINNS